ncbi:chemoreceptor glutamine deamidase CheD [Nitrincola iocasae]|jgi:chemotaxis protein CheD|uniref:Probable chemoreceptor glutamine deamidase CheD n=1 Tax=Nitrincola iocasae TaxID=2614693 RepID=A0A5J6LBZ8_9GAMM|nr:chemoreceptor glutamine deamidase CheD [Nitrincola iocasae]QEW06129.1 chemoreceptor glutamine deamidase CheD [Nitrincola iocasae]
MISDEHLATNCYYDRYFDTQAVKVLPGQYFATHDDTMIVTVLGSCVSVCLRDRLSGIGGMNHFMLPHDSGADSDSLIAASGRYGVYAMELLVNHLLKLGASRSRLEAKVFGGGQVLKNMSFMNVGQRNVKFVMKHLRNESIPVLGKDVLDIYPRKVYFFPQTGKVMLKKIHSLHNSTIIDREKAYMHEIETQPMTGEVDLF